MKINDELDIQVRLINQTVENLPSTKVFLEYAWGKPQLMVKDANGGAYPISKRMKLVEMKVYLDAFQSGVLIALGNARVDERKVLHERG